MIIRRNAGNKIRLSKGDQAVVIISYILVIAVAFLCFYPFWYIIINSMVTREAIGRGVLIFPRLDEFFFATYRRVLTSDSLIRGAMISTLRVIVQVVTNVTLSAMFAFLVTRKNMLFRKFVYRYAIISMYVSGGLIPYYLLIRTYGLMNTFHVYWVPGMLGVWNVILIKTFMESIPAEMEESARIDGAGFLTVFFKIMIPLSKPILATCALFVAVGSWNAYFDNYLFVTDRGLQTIQMELFNYIREAESILNQMRQIAQAGGGIAGMAEAGTSVAQNLSSEAIRNTTTIVTMLPIMLVYPFLQKYFQSGIMLGAVKG